MSARVWLGIVPFSRVQVSFLCSTYFVGSFCQNFLVYSLRTKLPFSKSLACLGVLEPEELFPTVNSRLTDIAVNILEHEDEILLPFGSLEPEVASRVDKYDLRKSLAWDSAFFTNAGMLYLVIGHSK